MRWFCVAPALPNKAVLRIRTAPNSDADVCGRFSKGKAIAAFANVVDIRDENDPTSPPQKWLHVAYQDEYTGRWSQGYVMASLPDGMTLLVPWEEAGYIRCCNVDEARAILYDSAARNAQIVGSVDAGEGTRFAYGVMEEAHDRLRIFHDIYNSVWINAHDTDTVCEKIEHPNCTVPHSYFALNEELPPEAQIAIRAFPSREAETIALLSRGQVVEAQARCGKWLQVACTDGQDSWIMWYTGSRELLTEQPSHTSERCQLIVSVVAGSDAPVQIESENVQDAAVEVEEIEPKADGEVTSEQRPSLAVDDSSLSNGHDDDDEGHEEKAINGAVDAHAVAATELKSKVEAQKSPVTNLCEELASNGIASLEDALETSAAEQECDVPASGTLPWDERPLNGNRHHDAQDVGEFAEAAIAPQDVDHPKEKLPDEIMEAPKPEPSSSWEDRPISSKGQGTYSYKFEEAEVPVVQTELQTKELSYSWEDRPIAAKSHGTYDWESSVSRVEETPAIATEPSPAVDEPREQATEFLLVNDCAVAEDSVEEKEETFDDAQPEVDHDDSKYDAEDTIAQEDGMEEPVGQVQRSDEGGVWQWEEAPLPGRHARKVSHELGGDGTPPKLTPSKRALHEGAEEQQWNTAARRPSTTKRMDAIDTTNADTLATASSPSKSPGHPAVGVVAADSGSVTWHSNDASEDPGVFDDSSEVYSSEVEEVQPSTQSVQHSPIRVGHASHSAIGVVGTDNAISWHSTDAMEADSVVDDAKGQSVNTNGWSTSEVTPGATCGSAGDEYANSATLDEVTPIDVDDDGDYANAEEHMEDDAGLEQVQNVVHGPDEHVPDIEEDQDQDMTADPAVFHDAHSHQRDDEEMATEAPFEDATAEEHKIAADAEPDSTVYPENGHAAPAFASAVSIHSRLMARLTGLAGDRHNRILTAIAFDQGPDAILEALASTGEYDEDLLKYSPPPGPPTPAVAPSPSTSESGLLDVLYSRDDGDAFSTPKKKRPLGASNEASAKSSYSAEDKTEILAGILRRTPQKSKETHNKIVSNANPEEILEAEFGGCADELGLFGDYRYPSVSTARFSSGVMGTPTRASSLSMSSLPSPSFSGSASFASPVAKENPLKRSASAIAKTPPVALPRSTGTITPKRVESPPPPPPPPTKVPPPIQVPEKTIPVRSRTPSGLVPPGARSASGLPRPSLMSPSVATSQLRRSVTSAVTTTAAAVGRTRSLTASDEVKQRASLTSAPASSMARSQSMLPRKSMLPMPSPSKLAAPSPTSRFGLTRTNSMTSTAPSASSTPAASASATTPTSLMSRRTSFGFSRPTPTKKT